MIWVLIPLLTLLCWRVKIARPGEDCLERDETESVKGMFIIMVVITHFSQQVGLPKTDSSLAYVHFMWWYRQLIVVMFLLYSGWGVCLSLANKGRRYLLDMPCNRILRTCIVYWTIVPLYIGLRWMSGWSLTAEWIWKFAFAWSSYWYLFAIVWLYIITWGCFVVFDKQSVNMRLFAVTACVVIYMIVISRTRNGVWCYDTVLCYVLGMWLARYRDGIRHFLSGDRKTVIGWWVICSVLFAFIYEWRILSPIVLVVGNLIFAVAFLLLTAIVRFNNPILRWFGRNLVYIYLGHGVALQLVKLQRHSLFGHVPWEESYLLDFLFVCGATVLIVFPYRWLNSVVWRGVSLRLNNKGGKP